MSEFKDIKWNYDINANKGYDVYLNGSVRTIATVSLKDVSYMPNMKEAEANAKLIACAPEMLDLLDRILKGKFNVIEIEQLIKKATS